MSHSYKETSELGKGFVLFLVLIIIAVFGLHACTTSLAQGNQHTEIVTVCDKGSVQTGSGDSRSHEYRVYTSGQTYTVTDYYGSEGERGLTARTCMERSRSVRLTSLSLTGTGYLGHRLSGTSQKSPRQTESPPAPAAESRLASRRESLAVLSPPPIILLLVSSLHRCVSMLTSRKRRKRTFIQTSLVAPPRLRA